MLLQELLSTKQQSVGHVNSTAVIHVTGHAFGRLRGELMHLLTVHLSVDGAEQTREWQRKDFLSDPQRCVRRQ